MHACALIVAGGRGSRFGGSEPKQYLDLAGQPLIVWSLQAFQRSPSVESMVVVVAADQEDRLAELVSRYRLSKVYAVCAGGEERVDSVRAGLAHLPPQAEVVAVHDAARPLVTLEIIARVVSSAAEHGAALAAIPVRDTIKRATQEPSMVIERTVDRRSLYAAQTPQAFRVELLRQGYASPTALAPATDDAELVERLGHRVHLVEGDPVNFKITVAQDLELAEAMLRGRGDRMDGTARWPRTGVGYDVHRLVPGRRLVLGGEDIPFELGLLGHSDADVLCHAVGDALLGAACLGDLGVHFPPSDPRWEGASSLDLLRRIMELVDGAGYRVANVDAVVVCEEPKLASRVPAMRQNLGGVLRAETSCISIKATTSEGLGFTGRREGIAAYATLLLVPA